MPGELTPDAVTLGVVVSRLDDIKGDIEGLRDDLKEHQRNTVARGEWVQRNNHVDERFRHTDDKFSAQGREIAQLRTDVQSRRAPWWSVGALAVSGVALLVTLGWIPTP